MHTCIHFNFHIDPYIAIWEGERVGGWFGLVICSARSPPSNFIVTD